MEVQGFLAGICAAVAEDGGGQFSAWDLVWLIYQKGYREMGDLYDDSERDFGNHRYQRAHASLL